MTQKNPTVLITGGTDGLGKAAALFLSRHGYRVFAAGRSPSKREELNRLAHEQALPIHTLEMDVTDNASVQIGVELVLEKGGGIDFLINNAGVGYMATIEDLRLEDFRKQFDVNLFGVIRVTQTVLPHMRQRRHGRILMMSSVAGLVSPPTYGAYSSSKHALEGLTDALRLEMYLFGVDVILIEPGYIITNFQQTAQEFAKPYFDHASGSPYARIYAGALEGSKQGRERSKTTPEDCAKVILKAMESPNPKARYTVTPMAKWVSFGKRILPDTLLDSIMRKRFGITRES
ncbi:MAG: SDR family oxidoreductase [Candidatus Acidiferrum sp.]